MRSSISIVFTSLLAASSVAAHGKVAVMTGDMGGNGTALGIQGGVIPGPGRNAATEPDTTVFKGANAAGCGRTKGAGDNTIEGGTKQAMALSGDTLPQVSPGGEVSGTLHVVTTDGFGPYTALLDTTGTGDFSKAQKLTVTKNVAGTRGNGRKGVTGMQKLRSIFARATNVNEDFPIAATIPADAKCTGTVNGIPNVCMVKFINPSNAGPFGGCVPIQMVDKPAAGAPAAPAAAAAAAPAVAAAAPAADAAAPAAAARRRVRI